MAKESSDPPPTPSVSLPRATSTLIATSSVTSLRAFRTTSAVIVPERTASAPSFLKLRLSARKVGLMSFHRDRRAFPGFHFNASGAYISAQGKGQFEVVLPDGLSTPLFELDAKLEILIENTLRIEDWVIKGNVKLTDAELAVKSPIVPISIHHLQKWWNEALSIVVSQIANQILANGLPLPSFPKASPVNPKFIFSDHELLFCSDLKAN
ncbi:hypothetical protein L596_004836 [Steinernema carpocapsae]|uniref:Lipid-binding serum glycoprotein C-terminal domain-containing protein n=1 Tax=Steinernema carpocapsae TaxID=34508 RepID=A0A4U8UX56_STECR|nr:hypothetical protein L596_004836 [Steinernema carpocapsae]